MKKLWSNYVFIIPRKFSNIGHNFKLCSWKLSRSSTECWVLGEMLSVFLNSCFCFGMKKVGSNYVSNVPKKISNIGYDSRLCSWKLSRSSSECLNHISQIKSQNDMMFES